MKNFVLNRDLLIHGGAGNSVQFKKGVPTFVPRDMWPVVMQKGAVPEDGKPITPVDEEPQAKRISAEDRMERIKAAVIELIAENDANKFGANNRPRVAAVKDVVGFSVDRKDIDTVWELIRAGTHDDEI